MLTPKLLGASLPSPYTYPSIKAGVVSTPREKWGHPRPNVYRLARDWWAAAGGRVRGRVVELDGAAYNYPSMRRFFVAAPLQFGAMWIHACTLHGTLEETKTIAEAASTLARTQALLCPIWPRKAALSFLHTFLSWSR
jgi:hypothetical protein